MADLPKGVTPGLKMPGGVMIYIANQPQPGVVLLRRHLIGEGMTVAPRVRGRMRSVEQAERAQALRRERGEIPQMPGQAGQTHYLVPNPYAGRAGWTLYAMGKAAYRDRPDLNPKHPDDKRLGVIYKRIPIDHRFYLVPRCPDAVSWSPSMSCVPANDPLAAPRGGRWRPWIDDDCIVTLIVGATKLGLKVAVPASQVVELEDTKFSVYPLQQLQKIFASGEGRCGISAPQGMTMEQAANALGYAKLRTPLSQAPEKVHAAWLERFRRATNDTQRLILNMAYHRILLWKFLRGRRLTPTVSGRGGRALGNEIERRANLVQAYRVFVFDKRGCPVGLNMKLLEANNLTVSTILDRKVTHGGFTRASAAVARKWGTWLYSDVLQKRVTECRPPEEIDGLPELLAMARAEG